jgi:hypothetical protein
MLKTKTVDKIYEWAQRLELESDEDDVIMFAANVSTLVESYRELVEKLRAMQKGD